VEVLPSTVTSYISVPQRNDRIIGAVGQPAHRERWEDRCGHLPDRQRPQAGPYACGLGASGSSLLRQRHSTHALALATPRAPMV
jgi:hypothetical protein